MLGKSHMGQRLLQVSKKTSQERLPGLDRYSDRDTGDNASHDVVYDRAYKKENEEVEEDIPPEEIGRAFLVRSPLVCLARSPPL